MLRGDHPIGTFFTSGQLCEVHAISPGVSLYHSLGGGRCLIAEDHWRLVDASTTWSCSNVGSTMVDAELADRVLSVLEKSPHVPHRFLRLETNQGHVVLRGVVRSYYQKQMAQEVLLGLEGVEHVENQLEVEWGPQRNS